jgi:hypothetical protein
VIDSLTTEQEDESAPEKRHSGDDVVVVDGHRHHGDTVVVDGGRHHRGDTVVVGGGRHRDVSDRLRSKGPLLTN